MPSLYQKTIAVALLASFSLSVLAAPLSVLAEDDTGPLPGTTPAPGEGTKITPVFTGGLGAIFSGGGTKCGGGLLGSIGSTISSLAGQALGALGLDKLFGGGASVSLNVLGTEGAAAAIASTPALAGVSISEISGMTGSELGSAVAAGAITPISDVSDIATGATGAGLSLEGLGSGEAAGGLSISSELVTAGVGLGMSLLSGLGGGGGRVPVTVDPQLLNDTAKTRANTDALVKKECIYDPLTKAITALLIRSLTNAIIGWIQGGSGGFVSNFEKEFRHQIDARAGEFLNQLAGINLCGNIGGYLQITLRTPGLRQRLECTVTQIVQNLENFFRRFEEGGWPAFIRVSLEPQNNPYGAYFIALDAKTATEAARGGAYTAGFQAGGGFLGFEVEEPISCEDVQVGENQFETKCYTSKSVKTPGQTVAHLLNKSVAVGIDFAVAADEIDEAIVAIINALINKLLLTSFGDKGEGVFAPELSGQARVDPGDFAGSTVTEQYTREIARADAAIRVLDDRILQSAATVFAESAKVTELETKLKDLQQKLSAATAGSLEYTQIQNQITETQKAIETAKAKAKDSRGLFELARSTKVNVALVKSEFIKRRSTVLSTASLQTMQKMAEDRIFLTNLLDGFLEVAQIIVGDLPVNADLQINTLQQINEALAIGKRTVGRVDESIKQMVASKKPGLASAQAALTARKIEINRLIQDLEALKTALMKTVPAETVRQKAVEAGGVVDSITRQSANADAALAGALKIIAP